MKLAFVTPWYGPNIPGGAESEARRTAQRLHQAGYEVEILTTCIRDFFADWGKNYHKPGIDFVNGLLVRRFRVEKRDKAQFNAINRDLIQRRSVSAEAERLFINEMFRAPDLYRFIEEQSNQYIFFFIPYMFASSYFGAQICPERSVIIPCLHDEGYAYMDIFREMLPAVRALAFNTQSEMALAANLYGPTTEQIRSVVGIGVETDFEYDAARFREKYDVAYPFILYVGRKAAEKNTPLLVDYWLRYVQENETDAKLIFIGPGEMPIPAEAAAQVLDLGFVSLQDKYDAYAAATALCQPSRNESFSLVMMESWLTKTPVLVHAGCNVTRDHCRQSNGGLYFANYDEFAATIDYLLGNVTAAQQMGRQGYEYVMANFQWPMVLAKYDAIISAVNTGL